MTHNFGKPGINDSSLKGLNRLWTTFDFYLMQECLLLKISLVLFKMYLGCQDHIKHKVHSNFTACSIITLYLVHHCRRAQCGRVTTISINRKRYVLAGTRPAAYRIQERFLYTRHMQKIYVYNWVKLLNGLTDLDWPECFWLKKVSYIPSSTWSVGLHNKRGTTRGQYSKCPNLSTLILYEV